MVFFNLHFFRLINTMQYDSRISFRSLQFILVFFNFSKQVRLYHYRGSSSPPKTKLVTQIRAEGAVKSVAG